MWFKGNKSQSLIVGWRRCFYTFRRKRVRLLSPERLPTPAKFKLVPLGCKTTTLDVGAFEFELLFCPRGAELWPVTTKTSGGTLPSFSPSVSVLKAAFVFVECVNSWRTWLTAGDPPASCSHVATQAATFWGNSEEHVRFSVCTAFLFLLGAEAAQFHFCF